MGMRRPIEDGDSNEDIIRGYAVDYETDEPTFWQAMFSRHYVGWTTPFMEGVMRGAFWAHVLMLPPCLAFLLLR